MYEHHTQPLIPRRKFVQRLAWSTGAGVVLIVLSLAIGMVGYHVLEGLAWIDAFVNASMLLGGMGPVATLQSFGGKLFAGVFALYCGLAVILVAGIMLSPIIHRFFHKLHIDVAGT